VIGREARDYVWIMARTPEIPAADYQRIVAFLKEQGYDVSRIQMVPQRWAPHGALPAG
jgi:apolipoprotein D and lipocalin family protein